MKKMGLLALVLLIGLMPIWAQDVMEDEDLLAILEEYATESDPGLVVVINEDGEYYGAAFGAADLDSGEQVVMDDAFRIGSVTKPMVAVTLLSLVEADEVGLDDPIADYIPDDIVNNLANADEATVRQILQMTSGIPDYLPTDAFYDAVLDAPDTFWTPEETLAFAYGEPADFAVGSDYNYSNSNYNLAQIIIEGVTGEPLADVLQAVVFEPAEMDTCYLESTDTFAKNIVRGYDYADDSDDLVDVTEINDGVGLGDGGVVCTAADLAKFMPALIEGDLIGEDMLEEMLTAVDDGAGGQYGLGIDYAEDGYMLGHDGSTSGFQSTMVYFPEEYISVVVLTNFAESEVLADVAEDAITLWFEY